jgi:hypothetical protein
VVDLKRTRCKLKFAVAQTTVALVAVVDFTAGVRLERNAGLAGFTLAPVDLPPLAVRGVVPLVVLTLSSSTCGLSSGYNGWVRGGLLRFGARGVLVAAAAIQLRSLPLTA